MFSRLGFQRSVSSTESRANGAMPAPDFSFFFFNFQWFPERTKFIQNVASWTANTWQTCWQFCGVERGNNSSRDEPITPTKAEIISTKRWDEFKFSVHTSILGIFVRQFESCEKFDAVTNIRLRISVMHPNRHHSKQQVRQRRRDATRRWVAADKWQGNRFARESCPRFKEIGSVAKDDH